MMQTIRLENRLAYAFLLPGLYDITEEISTYSGLQLFIYLFISQIVQHISTNQVNKFRELHLATNSLRTERNGDVIEKYD